MKKIFFPATILMALAMVFTSCNMNSPKDTAQKWLTAFYHMDYETAKKYSTEDTKKLLATFQQFSALTNDTMKQHMMKLQVEIKDVKEKGDTAMVSYIVKEPKENNKDTETPKEQKLKLIKQQGKWLVAKSKQDDMGEEPAAADQSAPMPADTAGPMPADTTATPK